MEAALVLLRRQLPFAYAVRLAAVVPRARLAAIDPQAWQRRPAIARLPHIGRRRQAQALHIGDNVAPLALAEAVVRRVAQMLAELGRRNSALTLSADEYAPFVEVQQPAQQRLRHGGRKTMKMKMDNGRESVETAQRQ
jgi:hypothetical protein